MRILLRQVRTGLLYAGPEKWTLDYSEARDFERPDAAMDAVTESALPGMEVLMHFENPLCDVPLTIFDPAAAAC
jgi:hypothetical protein